MTMEHCLTVRLRDCAPQTGHYGAHGASVLMIQAAEEIERLRSALIKSDAALEQLGAAFAKERIEAHEARLAVAASAERIKDLETTISHMSREGHL